MSETIPTYNNNKQSIRLLVVEEDAKTNRVLSSFLNRAKFFVISTTVGNEVLELLEKEDINIVLLDIMMSNYDGIAILTRIRERYDLPIIIIAAQSKKEVIELVFSSGADDFIIKPFSPEQILDRINRVIDITTPHIDSTKHVNGDIQLISSNSQFTIGKNTGDLSLIETRLFEYFINNPNKLLPYGDLLKIGWSNDGNKTKQDFEMLRLAINHLRKKIEPDINNPSYLPRISEEGYIFRPMSRL